MGYKSSVAKASNKSLSVRTTVPEEVVKLLKIKPGDVLDWEPGLEKGRQIMKVKKLE